MTHKDHVIGETVDSQGMRVVLLERVWTGKILRDHPEMRDLRSAMLLTIVFPDHFEPDSRPDRTRYFSMHLGPSRWLLVTVSYEQAPARIITAYGRRKDPPLWKPST